MASVTANSAGSTHAATPRDRLRRRFRQFFNEPFFQFFALGGLLFGHSENVDLRARVPRIEISSADLEGIKNNYRQQYGDSPSDAQLAILLDQHVKEEMFYHEALKLKLDENDEIVRRRLVQKYEFLQQDVGISKDPTEEDLRAFYRLHNHKYEVPEYVTFNHVFFSIDQGGLEEAKARAHEALVALTNKVVTHAPGLGDNFPAVVDYSNATATQVRRAFGSSAFADEIFMVHPGTWTGPFPSELGWHLVYVAAHEPAALPEYEDVRDAVRRDYIEDRREAQKAQAFESLKKHYLIVRG